MKIATKFKLTVSQDEVWEVILNPHNIAKTFPGCESVAEIDAVTYVSIVTIKLYYLKARFKLVSKIVEQYSPFHLVTHTTWEGINIPSSVSQITSLKLISSNDSSIESSTEVSIDTELNITGTIANLGAKFMRTKIECVTADWIQSMKFLIEKNCRPLETANI